MYEDPFCLKIHRRRHQPQLSAGQSTWRKSGKVRMWGLGALRDHFAANDKKRVARKLQRIIPFHFGLVTCRFHFGKTQKVIMLMIFGILDVSMTPKTNYI